MLESAGVSTTRLSAPGMSVRAIRCCSNRWRWPSGTARRSLNRHRQARVFRRRSCWRGSRGCLRWGCAAPRLLGRVGQVALRAGALETAVTILEAGVTLARDDATSDLLLDFAEALVVGGRPADATGVYQRVLARPELPPMSRARALRELAHGLYFTGRHEAAAARFGECVALATRVDPEVAVHPLVS